MIFRKTILAACLAALCSMTAWAQAQKQRVAIDGDTGRGIPGVSITAKDFTIVTDSMGYFTLPKDCKTLVFSHINYVSYMVNLNDLGDTVLLYNNYQHLDEVTVFGTPGEDPLKNLKQGLKLNKTEVELQNANPNGNLLGLLKHLVPKKWRSKKQELKEKEKKVLKEY